MSSTEITETVAIPHCFLSVPDRHDAGRRDTERTSDVGKIPRSIIIYRNYQPAVKKNKCVFPMIYRLIQDPEKVQRLTRQTEADTFLRILFESIETE